MVAGLSQGYLSQLESGVIDAPSASVLERLAGAYGLTYAELSDRLFPRVAPVNTYLAERINRLSAEQRAALLAFLDTLG